MKKAGIIGGLGPASTLDYYQDIISGYRKIMKTNEYPSLVIDSVNMTEVLSYVAENKREQLVSFLMKSVKYLTAAGADFAVMASNTPHIVFEELKKLSPIPLISIVEATCKHAKSLGCKKVVVLGTLYTMKNGLYVKPLKNSGIEAFVPESEEQMVIQNIIFPNLEDGIVLPEEKEKMIGIAAKLIKNHNADGLVLGCTELPLMIKPEDMDINILNTTQIHIQEIIKEMIAD